MADEIAKITVTDLRLPRALVGMILGANLAVAGALLQTITRNPLASPTLLSVNSGASLAMVTASAFSPLILSGYSIALVASIGGGLSWFVVMLISNGWKDNSGDRSRVILAGDCRITTLCRAHEIGADYRGRSCLRYYELASWRHCTLLVGMNY